MNNLSAFLGGSAAMVALRLIVVSFIVGIVLVTFGFDPGNIIDSFVNLVRRLIDYGLTDFRGIGRVLATGALVVIPVWIVLRLLDSRRPRA
jgi:hypothetical protein